ncbi:MAG: hypothetical protein K0R34_2145 [Herbinix sp.]|nr:hypothetical protein [Herbinix sp.]
MAYVYKDLDGKEHELYKDLVAEELINITTGDVTGYRTTFGMSEYRISKETYEAIARLRGKK